MFTFTLRWGSVLLALLLMAMTIHAQDTSTTDMNQLESRVKELDASLQSARQSLLQAKKVALANKASTPLPATDRQLSLPRLSKAPIIDGIIDADEWAEATVYPSGVGPFGTMIAREASLYFIGWNADYFYIAQRMPLREGETPVRLNRKPIHDLVDPWETEMEVYLDRKTTGSIQGSFCRWQFMGNAAGNQWDREEQYTIGQNVPSWNAKWDFKQRVTPDGKYWETEMAFPRTSVYQDKPIKEGDRWWIGMAASPQHPWQWSGFYGWNIPTTFREDIPSIRVYHPEHCVTNKKLALDFEVVNTTRRQQQFTMVARLWDPSSKQIAAEKSYPLDLAPGQRFQTTVDEAGQVQATKSYQLLIMAQQGNTSLYTWSQTIDYANPENNAGLKVEANAAPFGLNAAYYPLKNVLIVTADKYDLPQRDEVTRVQVMVKPQGGVTATNTANITKFDYEQGDTRIDLPANLKAGIYSVTADMLDVTGKILSSHSVTFERKELTKEFPWLNNTIGEEFIVPRTFQPISVQGNTINGYKKTIILEGSALPKSIKAAGIELLAGPIRLRGTTNGQTFLLTPAQNAPIPIGKTTQATSSFIGKAKGGSLTANISYRFDYDGVSRVEMTLTPSVAGDKVSIDGLQLVIPFAAAATTHFMVNGDSMRISNHAGYLPGAGTVGTVWKSTDMPGQDMTVGSFIPIVHLGNLNCGLTWFADSDKGWWPSAKKPALEIVRTANGTVELVCNLASDAVTISAPRTIVFGMCTVPIRKVTPFKSSPATIGFGYEIETGRWDPQVTTDRVYARMYPDNPTKFKTYADITHRYNKLTKPYVELSSADYFSKENTYFSNEWSNGVSESATDNRIYWTEKFIKDCNIDGYYMDNLFNRLQRDPLVSSAYLLPDGRVQPGYNLWNLRNYVRRLRNTFEKYRNPVMIVIHNTDFQFAPVVGYADLVMGGENPTPSMGTPDFMDMWPRDWMDVMYNEPLWGYKLSHLYHFDWASYKDEEGNYDRTTAWKNHRTAMATMLVHGVEFFQGIEYADYINSQYKLFKKLPGNMDFIPSWQANGLFKVANGDKDIDVAVYRKPDAMLVIVANYAKDAKRTSIWLDFPRLITRPKPLENRSLYDFESFTSTNYDVAEADSPTTVNAGSGADATLNRANILNINVKPRDFRVYLIINEPVAQGIGF